MSTGTASDGTPSAGPGGLRDILRYFLKLGTVGFGGPIALAGYMQRDLVEKRGWITKKDYLVRRNGRVDAKSIQPVVDSLAANGFIQKFDVAKYLDLSYLPK